MGWWAKFIMSGDGPLDIQGDIFDICGVEQFPDEGDPNDLTKNDLEGHLEAIEKYCSEYEDEIAWQVFGYLILTTGVKVSKTILDSIIKACDEDEWAKEDLERMEIIQNFKTQLQNYPNDGVTEISVENRGLFESMFG